MRDECLDAWPPGLERLAGIGLWSIDLATGTTTWSEGQHHVYGVERGTVASIGDWAALVHPDDRALWQRSLDDALDREAVCSIDHRVVRPADDVTRWVRSRAVAVDGTLGGVTVDVTDDHLATVGLQSFLADAAHELRTPAAAIGQAVAALKVVDAELRPEVVEVLARQAGRLRTLTTDLVDLAQLDAGPVAVVLEPVPLDATCDAAVMHAPPPAGHTVEVDVAPDVHVLATPLHLDRVLVNLLTNAYRYGGPHVVVRGRPGASGRVVLEVADDGPGVAPEAVDELFHAFRKGAHRHPEASGLGLAIVARLVHRFGGEVRYRDGAPGAVFVVELACP